MSSIYSINDWSLPLNYLQNDVVRYSSLYYYALANIAASTPFSTTYWGGYQTVGSETKPLFLWNPSYSSPANHAPKVKRIQFGDGYEQRVQDGIYNTLFTFDMSFDLRSSKEAFAILHFLNQRKGVESFYFVPPSPYAERKKFVCFDWTHTEVFFDNHSIRARFEERVA